MGNVFKKRTKNIEIANILTRKDLGKYLHLDLKGKIIIKKDHGSSIAEIEPNFENHFPAFVHVWPNNYNTRNISPAESDISFEEIVVSTKICK